MPNSEQNIVITENLLDYGSTYLTFLEVVLEFSEYPGTWKIEMGKHAVLIGKRKRI